MTRGTDELWRLDELGARVKHALSVGYQPAHSGRVRAVPDRRTIRYYTTLGLVDRPAEMRGRTAYYGPRHLLQLVAIKRLQGEGLSLSQVQHRLAGLDDDALAGVARLPEDLPGAPAQHAEAAASAGRREAFWAAAPAALPALPDASARDVSNDEEAVPLAGVTLAPDATLLLACGRTPSPDDLRAIRAAAGPLIELLERRGLLSKEDRS
jgi:DNA-binding transcriptional MerR regulator